VAVALVVLVGVRAPWRKPRRIDRLSGGGTLVLAVLLLHERAPASAWLDTAVMLRGAVIIARS
jgi:hypothetical protein